MKINFRWKRRLSVIQSEKTTNTPTDHTHSLIVMFVWFLKTWTWPQLSWKVTLTKPSKLTALSRQLHQRLPEVPGSLNYPMILQTLEFSEVIWYHLHSPEDQQVRGSYWPPYFECLHNYTEYINMLGFSSFLWDVTLHPARLPQAQEHLSAGHT